MNPAFWKNKTVLVTGHTGFKGSWISLWLQSLGARVVGYALPPPTEPNMFGIARVAEGMCSVEGNVCDHDKLTAVFRKYSPEIVIHMAAQPLVRYSYEFPQETYLTNVIGTVNVLEAVRTTESVRVAVNVTTDKCYENKEWLWAYRENEPVGGYDPYSSSKACAELVTSAYRSSYFSGSGAHAALASARAGNVIGGGDWARDRLVPDIMQSFMKGDSVVIRNPGAIRPWQHVLDPLCGYLMLAEKLWGSGDQYASPWNFGPDSNDARPVSWIVELLARLWGGNAGWKLDHSEQPHEAGYLKLDSSKARILLGWQPKLPLHNGIEQTVNWFRAYQDGQDMHEYTRKEIADYEERE